MFDGVSMIVMENLKGQSLSKLLKRGRLPLERAAAIGAGIADGMAAAHARGIVHGDLKPGNVMIDAADGVKIMDFGLARRRLSVRGEFREAVVGPRDLARAFRHSGLHVARAIARSAAHGGQ